MLAPSDFAQPGILAPLCAYGRSLGFSLRHEVDPRVALRALRDGFDPAWGVVGLGDPLLQLLAATVPGLRTFPALAGPGVAVPSTQQALWIQLRADDCTTLFDRSAALQAMTGEAFELDDALDMFKYADGRDLTGYEDGTENPDAEASPGVALVAAGAGLVGSSFVAVQRWSHDLRQFHAHSAQERDHMIGRRRDSNEEIDDAPASAHVKRAAQESFEPEAFMVRRSVPWMRAHDQGLEFIAYGRSLDAYEQVLRRMVGQEDGIADALFRFSRPVSGGYYWCPPIAAGRLDLSAVLP
jgi:putative iron-dependent peroxidase